IIEILVRLSFIELYFNKDYLEILNQTFIDQISSQTTIYTEKKEIIENNIKITKYLNFIEVENDKRKKGLNKFM
ncbi:hypothetical protein, partial [Hyphomonas beringensis]